MRFSLSWLKTYLETTATAKEIAETLVNLGIEVESVEDESSLYDNFILGKIDSFKKHPDADRLNVCQIDIGEKKLIPVVCGATNLKNGMLVPLAQPGAIIPETKNAIKVGKIRGVESFGMLCTAKELGLGENHSGILDISTKKPVGAPLSEALGLNEIFIDVSITPNRADCFSILGIARDLAATGIGKLKKLEVKQNLADIPQQNLCTITSPLCSQFLTVKIENTFVTESPDFIKKRLIASGMTPINILVDVTNYIALEIGQPMHVYDADKVSGILCACTNRTGEKLKCLDEKTITLQKEDLVIADDRNVLGLAGIMGGISSSVTESTTSIILEAASFDPVSIAISGQNHNITSNSRTRFERGVDPLIAQKAILYATQLIETYAQGKVTAFDFKQGSFKKKNVLFNPALLKEKTGVQMSEAEMREILAKLDMHVTDNWNIEIPSWRYDIEIPEDIVEELLRVKGYDMLPTTSLPPKHQLPPEDTFLNLSVFGVMECITLSFTSQEKAKLFHDDWIELKNPISSELAVMRPSLFCGLLTSAAYNLNHGQERCGFCEKGSVFYKVNGTPKETPMLAGFRVGNFLDRTWYGCNNVVDVHDAKATCLKTLRLLGLEEEKMQITRDAPRYYHPYRSGCFRQGKRIIAYFGEIHPSVVKAFGIKKQCIGFEAFTDNIPPKTFKPKPYEASIFPKTKLDLSFIVDLDLETSNICQLIAKYDEIIQDVYVFDVYQGEPIPEGKKAVAFQFTLQPFDKTLTEDAIKTLMNGIISKVQSSFGATLRS